MIVNLTPHALNIVITPDNTLTVEASGTVARLPEIIRPAGKWDGIPITITSYGEVEDLPAPQEGVLFVVSALVRLAVPDRKDVASPGRLIRNEAGVIIGCVDLTVNR